MCLYSEMVRVRVFASIGRVWHMRGSLRCHENLARVQRDALQLKALVIQEHNDCSATCGYIPREMLPIAC